MNSNPCELAVLKTKDLCDRIIPSGFEFDAYSLIAPPLARGAGGVPNVTREKPIGIRGVLQDLSLPLSHLKGVR